MSSENWSIEKSTEGGEAWGAGGLLCVGKPLCAALYHEAHPCKAGPNLLGARGQIKRIRHPSVPALRVLVFDLALCFPHSFCPHPSLPFPVSCIRGANPRYPRPAPAVQPRLLAKTTLNLGRDTGSVRTCSDSRERWEALCPALKPPPL
eukprot:1916960-Rhodomonas_salina.2